jgi:hypothetical protein
MAKRKSTNTNWKPTDKRFVAFFDILGFKDLVMRSSHEEIYDKLNNLSATKKWLENLTKESGIIDKIGDGEIYTVSFSDSIVLFSKNDNPENFKFFLVAVRWFFAKAIQSGTPLKGGIAYGEISLNKSEQIYFGQPIIDAYLMEEDVNYFGVVAHNSIEKYISENESILELDYINNIIIEFNTPLKCGKINHKNINYFTKIVLNDEIEKEQEREIIENIIKDFRLTSSGSPRRYIDNTLEVFKQIKI